MQTVARQVDAFAIKLVFFKDELISNHSKYHKIPLEPRTMAKS